MVTRNVDPYRDHKKPRNPRKRESIGNGGADLDQLASTTASSVPEHAATLALADIADAADKAPDVMEIEGARTTEEPTSALALASHPIPGEKEKEEEKKGAPESASEITTERREQNTAKPADEITEIAQQQASNSQKPIREGNDGKHTTMEKLEGGPAPEREPAPTTEEGPEEKHIKVTQEKMLLPDTLRVKDVMNILYAIVPEEFSHEQMATDLKVLQAIKNIAPHQTYLNQVYEDLYDYMDDLGIKKIEPTTGGRSKKGGRGTQKTVSKEWLLKGFEKSYFLDKGIEPTDKITSTKVKQQIETKSAGLNPFKLAKVYANKPLGHGILDRLAKVLNFPRTKYILEAYEDGKAMYDNAQESLEAPMYEIKRFENAKNVMVTKITQLLALFPSDMHDHVLQKIIPSLFVDQGVPPDVFTQWFETQSTGINDVQTSTSDLSNGMSGESSKYASIAESAAKRSKESADSADSSAKKVENLVNKLFEFVKHYQNRNKSPLELEFLPKHGTEQIVELRDDPRRQIEFPMSKTYFEREREKANDSTSTGPLPKPLLEPLLEPLPEPLPTPLPAPLAAPPPAPLPAPLPAPALVVPASPSSAPASPAS